jgi:hypothetical protein
MKDLQNMYLEKLSEKEIKALISLCFEELKRRR